MSFDLKLTASAGKDIQQARNWYNNKKAGLGEEFVLCIEEGLKRLNNNPHHFQFITKIYRAVIIRKFPYRIVFFVEEKNVIVIGVIHMSRNPEIWKKE